ncbi:MAG: FAD-binding oxidoreductase [Rhodospirillaceae bacterium]|nr:FAD-binding oxidoreductase [Rhodospirillaceae bacterium]
MTDVVIVGGGIVGASAAWYLVKKGIRPLLLEKGRIAGEQSSRNWGFVRQQGRDPFEVPLMIECNRMWQGLEAELGADLGWRMGGNIKIADNPKTMAKYEGWLDIARQFQLRTRAVTPAEIADIVPGIHGNFVGGIFTENDGQADPEKVSDAFAAAARKGGAEIATGEAALKIETEGGRISGVQTEKRFIKCDKVIVAAGAWSARLLRPLGVDLPQLSIRASVTLIDPVRPITDCGVWSPQVGFRQRSNGAVNLADGKTDHFLVPDSLQHMKIFWPGLQSNRGDVALKFGRPFFDGLLDKIRGEPASAYAKTRVHDPAPNEERNTNAIAAFKSLFPDIGPITVQKSWAGMIDMTPDMIPVIDAPDTPAGLVIVTGMSGHGFGMGPITGRIAADLATEGRTAQDISGFRFARFRDGPIYGIRAV